MTPRNWPRLARYVRERRDELGLTQEEVATRGGPSTATLRLIESAAQDSYRAKSLRQLEDALGWTPGSARAILAGREPQIAADGDKSASARTGTATLAATTTLTAVPDVTEDDNRIIQLAQNANTLALDREAPKVEKRIRDARPDAPGAEIFPESELAGWIWDHRAVPDDERIRSIALILMNSGERRWRPRRSG